MPFFYSGWLVWDSFVLSCCVTHGISNSWGSEDGFGEYATYLLALPYQGREPSFVYKGRGWLAMMFVLVSQMRVYWIT